MNGAHLGLRGSDVNGQVGPTVVPAAKATGLSNDGAFVSVNTKRSINDEIYGSLEVAFDLFNEKLFDKRLPPAAFSLQRRRDTYGHFHGGCFMRRDGSQVADEISLNPQYLRTQPVMQVLQMIGHEMCHAVQFHFPGEHGAPSRAGYHNKGLAAIMNGIGLIPSDTGAPGGKQTGQRVLDYVRPGGRFEQVCKELLALRAVGWGLDWGDRDAVDGRGRERR